MRRKNSNIEASFLAAFLSVILLFTTGAPYYANSAQTHWSGVDATGAMVSDKESPIVVEKEVLTFDITEFPSNYYHGLEEYLAYSGKVTAEYTFYNPSDYTVTAKLLFPYGKMADYGEYFDEEGAKIRYNADADKYTVQIDGQDVETTVRHTLSYRYSQFSLQEDLPRVIDGYMTDEFYNPTLPVYCLTYEVSGLDQKNATVALKWSKDGAQTKFLMEGASGGKWSTECIEISKWATEHAHIQIWVFGEYTEPSDWTVYENGACEKVVPGKVELVSKEPVRQMTLQEYLMEGYNLDSGILESDWYNARLQNILNNEEERGYIRSENGNADFESNLLRWYEYEIILQSGQRMVNTVTAPMYPGINLRYDPDIFEYTYLLSPATTWKEFGDLDIILNTPYYMTKSSVQGYEKTESGYRWMLNGLPEGELHFTLSTGENPIIPVTSGVIISFLVNMGIMALIAVCLVGGGLVLGYIVILVIQKKRKKK